MKKLAILAICLFSNLSAIDKHETCDVIANHINIMSDIWTRNMINYDECLMDIYRAYCLGRIDSYVDIAFFVDCVNEHYGEFNETVSIYEAYPEHFFMEDDVANSS